MKELLLTYSHARGRGVYQWTGGRVKVENDHKLLGSVVLQPFHVSPQRLRTMLLRLHRYNLEIQYKNGKEMNLEDTLSRAPLPEVSICEFVYELKEINHKEALPFSSEQWQQMRHAAADNPVLQELRIVIQHGWPENKERVTQCSAPNYDSMMNLRYKVTLYSKCIG